jgi:hypothetical protein
MCDPATGVAVYDPLLQHFDLPLKATLYPLGFPLEVATNSAEAICGARESWCSCPQLFSREPVRLRIAVAEGKPSAPPAPPVYRAQEHLLAIVADGANYAMCDLRGGFGFAWLTAAAAFDRDYLRFYFVEAMAYAILTSLHMAALHAACVSLDGRGVLLCGPSGAGKTSLAWACARRGFTFVSDDVSSLVRDCPGPTVIGKPAQFRFRDDAGELLPELRGLMPRQASHGRPSIEVRTQWIPEIRTAWECHVDHVVFLKRGGQGRPRLQRVSAAEARSRLEAELPVLDPRSRERQIAALDNILGAGTFELSYGELGPAVDVLESLCREGDGSAAGNQNNEASM